MFQMKVMDSFYSDAIGLVVTGIVDKGVVKKGDRLIVKTKETYFEVEIIFVALPGMNELLEANVETNYFGLGIKDRIRGEIQRGDKLISEIKHEKN